jgi:hypothetical protein
MTPLRWHGTARTLLILAIVLLLACSAAVSAARPPDCREANGAQVLVASVGVLKDAAILVDHHRERLVSHAVHGGVAVITAGLRILSRMGLVAPMAPDGRELPRLSGERIGL